MAPEDLPRCLAGDQRRPAPAKHHHAPPPVSPLSAGTTSSSSSPASRLPPLPMFERSRSPDAPRPSTACPDHTSDLIDQAEIKQSRRQESPWPASRNTARLRSPPPVPVENRAPASSSSQIRPSPSSPPTATSMSCCNIHGQPHLFLRFCYGASNLVQIRGSVCSSCENPLFLAQLCSSSAGQLVGLQPGDHGFETPLLHILFSAIVSSE